MSPNLFTHALPNSMVEPANDHWFNRSPDTRTDCRRIERALSIGKFTNKNLVEKPKA